MADAQQTDLEKLKWLAGVAIFFGVSLFMSYSEIRYRLGGETAEARLLDTDRVETTTRSGGTRSRVEFSYRFQDGDETRVESDRVSTGFEPRLGRDGADEPTIMVQYLPGEPEASRVAGNHKLFWVWALFTSVVGAIVALVKFFVDYHRFRSAHG